MELEEKENWEGYKREGSGKRWRRGRGVRRKGVGREGELGGVSEGKKWEEKDKSEGCKRERSGKRRRSWRGVRGKGVGREGEVGGV